MAKGIWTSVGGDVDLDVITAGAGDILNGKIIVDEEGEALAGTMPEKAGTAWQAPRNITYNGTELSMFTNNGHYADSNYLFVRNAQLASYLGIEPWKVRCGITISGVTGTCQQWCSYDVVSGHQGDSGQISTDGKWQGHAVFNAYNIGFTPVMAVWWSTVSWTCCGFAGPGSICVITNGDNYWEGYNVNDGVSQIYLTQERVRLPLPHADRTYVWHIVGYYI